MRTGYTVGVVLVVVLAGCSGLGGGPPAAEDVGLDEDTATTAASDGTTVPSAGTNGTMSVHFINVGQSVATLVVGPTGETMLIDTGHFRDDGEYVLEYLERHGIERLDALVVSHNDADHIGGNAAIIDYYETEADGIGAIYDPGIAASTQTYDAYLDAVERHDVPLYRTQAGDQIPIDGVSIDVLGPPDPYIENEARNENSVVLKLTYGQTSFLFTGDAEDDQETQLVSEYGDRLNATILKAGHHGSSSSTGEDLLAAADPKAVVISSAYDSQYGHPNEATLERLGSTPTFWTATHGDTVFVSDGERVAVRTQREAPIDPRRLREGEPIAPGTTDPVAHRTTFGGSGQVPTATPTVTDGGTPVDDTTTTDDGTTTAEERLEIVSIHADADGDDRTNLNDEYVTFTNTGDEPLDLSGYTIADSADHRYTVPDGVTLAPGETITLYTGSGTNTDDALYWDRGSPVWNNDGDTITVRAPDGTVVLEATYT